MSSQTRGEEHDHVSAPDVEEIVARMSRGEATWAATTLTERRNVLERFHKAVAASVDDWVEVARTIKQLPDGSPLVGEEWISGPYAVLGYVGALLETLRRLDESSDVLAGYPVTSVPGNRLAVHVLPHGIFDQLLLNGFHAEVWMPPGITEQEIRSGAGLGQRAPATTDGVALILGAGNIFSIAPLDVVYQLFAHNRAVVLKLNPVTEPLQDVFEQMFAPFIDLGVVTIVTGGADLGSALAYHPGISAVHITGSETTHDAVVWGTGDSARGGSGRGNTGAGQTHDQRARRRLAGHRRTRQMVTG